MSAQDETFMQLALEQAALAEQKGEVPVGALLVQDNQVIATGFNQPISTSDPTAHAEIVALRKGAQALNNYRLVDTTLYVTLEPCMMCLGAILHARVARLVYGASDPKVGAVRNKLTGFNHTIVVQKGVLEDVCSALLKAYFRKRR